jgi:acetolactate synthase-1/3 small subunit
MQHIISVLVENKFGVLARVSGLFSGRGFNIDSLSVGPTLDPTTAMMTIVTAGDDRIIEQITKQLNKLVDVIRVIDLTDKEYVERETALIKIHAQDESRSEALRIVDIFRGKIVDSTPITYTIEVSGDPKKIVAILNLLKPLGIKEFICTGRIAIPREEAKTASFKEEAAVAPAKDRRSRLGQV